jgi:fructokinase
LEKIGGGYFLRVTLLLGLSKQWPLETTLERAQAFACAVVGKRGATVADREFYRAFSEQWESD